MHTCTCRYKAAVAVRYHDLATSMRTLHQACQLSVLMAAHIAQQAQHGQQLIHVEGPSAHCLPYPLPMIQNQLHHAAKIAGKQCGQLCFCMDFVQLYGMAKIHNAAPQVAMLEIRHMTEKGKVAK